MSFLKNIWKSNTKHSKLSEEWVLAKGQKELEIELTDNQDGDKEISLFKLKYLGSTPVERASNETITAEAIKSIVRVAKAAGKKLARVLVQITSSGIKITEENSEKELMNISIYRISYCSADAANSRVFAFIAANSNDTIECHAFLCAKRKIAKSVTLTLARAFSMAYEAWRLIPTSTRKEKAPEIPDSKLIDLGDIAEYPNIQINKHKSVQNDWVSFEEEDQQRWNNNQHINLLCS